MSELIWKRGDGWVQYNPPRSHPSYEEWQKLKQKENENDRAKRQDHNQ